MSNETGDWRNNAACKNEDPEIFFPSANNGPVSLQIDKAKAICKTCPVVDECLSWALNTSQEAGVWGGVNEDERRALKRRLERIGKAATNR